MSRLEEKLEKGLKFTGIEITEEQKALLLNFIRLMDKWNKTYNLTSIRDVEQMVDKHLIDSIVVSEYLKGSTFIDVGTGPGLPGIPLAIINPDKNFYLLDSQSKRINFIKQVKREFNIKNICPILGRCENFENSQANPVHFDGILSRAFASLKDMLSLCGNMADQDTLFLALKGQIDTAELSEISDEYKIININKLKVPQILGERHLIVIGKNNG